MSTRKIEFQRILPEKMMLNPIQQKRLADLAGVEEKEVAGKSIAQLSDQFKFQIDPSIFLSKKVCGKVVKKDPVTGDEYPVPFATVYVEDSDCNMVLYHPVGNRWSWHFPLFCRKETLTKVQTDACGNFCAWIPRFDIDRILHWRRERHCFPIIYKRPILRDLVDNVQWPPVPNPPDPARFKQFQKFSPTVLGIIGGAKAEMIKRKLATAENVPVLGALTQSNNDSLNDRLFDHEMPPPFSSDFQKALSGTNIIAAQGASATDAIRADIAGKLGMPAEVKELEHFNPAVYRGPFYRCMDVFVPEWQIVFDVPDITFHVMQDTNGDGVEETIYSEGYFDVRWDEENLSDIKLVASSIAKESRACGTPHIRCSDTPDLLLAGFMPLRDTNYFDAIAGYALRPNRPIPTGIPGNPQSYPATTPFCGVLQFYGCVEVQNAVYYRVHQSIDNGTTYSPITGLGWNNYALTTPIPITSDSAGWYPVQPVNPVTLAAVPRASLEFPNFLLDWPTPLNEKSLLKIEIGDAAKTHIADSNPVAIVSDNTAPAITLNTLAWKYAGEPDSALRDFSVIECAMIKRGAVPRDIELVFEVSISGTHFRDAAIGTSGCGAGASFVPIADPANEQAHWHQTALDNFEVLHQRYVLYASNKPGCYGFSCTANSRSMNPSGADGGNMIPVPDWFYNPVYLYSRFDKSVAVVNEDL